jgi:hypothetical protein
LKKWYPHEHKQLAIYDERVFCVANWIWTGQASVAESIFEIDNFNFVGILIIALKVYRNVVGVLMLLN